MKKILIFADHNPIAIRSVIPNFKIGGFVQMQVEHMAGFVSALVQKPAKSLRELVVHQELHVPGSTT